MVGCLLFVFHKNPHATLFYEIKIRENQRDNQKWIIQRHWEHWTNTTQDDKKPTTIKLNGSTDPSKNRRILRTGQPDRADDRMIFIPSAENHCTCIIITYVVEFCFYSSSVVDLKVNVKVIYFTIHDREAIVHLADRAI